LREGLFHVARNDGLDHAGRRFRRKQRHRAENGGVVVLAVPAARGKELDRRGDPRLVFQCRQRCEETRQFRPLVV
jgi:hypothetical protein